MKEQRYILTGFVALSVVAFVVGVVGECQKSEPNGLDFFVNIVLGVLQVQLWQQQRQEFLIIQQNVEHCRITGWT